MSAFWQKSSAAAMDWLMCAAMNGVQWNHRVTPSVKRALQEYIEHCETLNRTAYYAAPALPGSFVADAPYWRWRSPVITPALPGGRPGDIPCANDWARADLYPGPEGWSAPTVIFLHALMSASDTGYRRWARRFHKRGWNAVFVHLPYHYSRTPAGFRNGELAITADLVRTGEGLRAGVAELRQLMAALRSLGTPEFGLWATSYGGWIGALLLSMEADFRWAALMTPILNMEHAIWRCSATAVMRHRLRQAGIEHDLIARHAHLTSPLCEEPLCGGERVLFGAGTYDRIAPRAEVLALAERWNAEVVTVPQGHFGFQLMPAIYKRLLRRGDI